MPGARPTAAGALTCVGCWWILWPGFLWPGFLCRVPSWCRGWSWPGVRAGMLPRAVPLLHPAGMLGWEQEEGEPWPCCAPHTPPLLPKIIIAVHCTAYSHKSNYRDDPEPCCLTRRGSSHKSQWQGLLLQILNDFDPKQSWALCKCEQQLV